MPNPENTNKPTEEQKPIENPDLLNSEHGDDAHAQAPLGKSDSGDAPLDTEKLNPPQPDNTQEIPKDVDFNDFLSVLDKKSKVVDIDKEKEKIENKSKPIVSEDKPVVSQLPKKEYPPERDLSAFPEDLRPVLKQMSNEAFERLAPIVQEHPKVKEELERVKNETAAKLEELKTPSTYWEHERAYTLTPEWEELNNDLSISDTLQKHWEEQLTRVEEGEDWEDLTQDKDGNLFKTKPQATTPKAKSYVMKNLLAIQNHVERIKEKGTNLIQTHKSRYTEDVGKITEVIDKYFKPYMDEKNPLNKVVKNTLDSIPKSFRSSPLARVVAALTANNVQLRLVLDNLKKNSGTKESFDKAVKNNGAGPSSKEINSGGQSKSSSPLDTVKFDDFTALLK